MGWRGQFDVGVEGWYNLGTAVGEVTGLFRCKREDVPQPGPKDRTHH